jgi:conjugal transfer/entry exclusion protein
MDNDLKSIVKVLEAIQSDISELRTDFNNFKTKTQKEFEPVNHQLGQLNNLVGKLVDFMMETKGY